MNNSVLVDTNVLIYAIDADSQFHHRALKFLSDPTKRFFHYFKEYFRVFSCINKKRRDKYIYYRMFRNTQRSSS